MAVDLVDILADGGGLKTLKSNLKERNESIEYNNNPLSTPLRPRVTTRRYDPALRPHVTASLRKALSRVDYRIRSWLLVLHDFTIYYRAAF